MAPLTASDHARPMTGIVAKRTCGEIVDEKGNEARKIICRPALAMFAVLTLTALIVGCGPRDHLADRAAG